MTAGATQKRRSNAKVQAKPADRQPLTKADTVALWYAVEAMVYQVRAMPEVESITPDQIEAERVRLTAAKRALRKVNKLRKDGR